MKRLVISCAAFGIGIGMAFAAVPEEHVQAPLSLVCVKDERVAPEDDVANSRLGQVVAIIDNRTVYIGTASKIGQNLIATAAHNILPIGGPAGKMAQRIYYLPYGSRPPGPSNIKNLLASLRRNGGTAATEIFIDEVAITLDLWPERLSSYHVARDVVFIRLAPSKGGTTNNDYFHLTSQDNHVDDQFEGTTYSIPAAASDRQRGLLLRQRCRVHANGIDVFYSDAGCGATGGRSGGPLLQEVSGAPYGKLIRGFISNVSKDGVVGYYRLTPQIVQRVELIRNGETRSEALLPLVRIKVDGTGRAVFE